VIQSAATVDTPARPTPGLLFHELTSTNAHGRVAPVAPERVIPASAEKSFGLLADPSCRKEH
jgi:hypothetical protein